MMFRRWAVRTIKDSKVKINHRIYQPEQPCPQLEGVRCLFGLYEGKPELVNLHSVDTKFGEDGISDPRLQENGYLLWMFWHSSDNTEELM